MLYLQINSSGREDLRHTQKKIKKIKKNSLLFIYFSNNRQYISYCIS